MLSIFALALFAIVLGLLGVHFLKPSTVAKVTADAKAVEADAKTVAVEGVAAVEAAVAPATDSALVP